jgi:hypothetical protein
MRSMVEGVYAAAALQNEASSWRIHFSTVVGGGNPLHHPPGGPPPPPGEDLKNATIPAPSTVPAD